MSNNHRTPDERAKVAAAGAILLLAGIWGYNWVCMKIAIAYSPPFTFAALRMLLGALALFAVMAALRRPFGVRSVPQLALLGLLQTAGFIGLASWALTGGGAGKIAVLLYTMPFWVLLLGWPLLGERIRGLQWAALAAGLGGLVLVIGPGSSGSFGSDALALGGGISWALSAIYAKRVRAFVRMDVLSMTAWQTLFGSLPLVVVAFAVPAHPIAWTLPFVLALAYNVVPATALGWLLWLYGLRGLSAANAGLIMLASPLVAMLASWLQLGERPGAMELGGAALIVLALGLISLRGLRAQRELRLAEAV